MSTAKKKISPPLWETLWISVFFVGKSVKKHFPTCGKLYL